MPTQLSHHSDYISRYGFSRWILRECVRANPLYVISAALLAYGVMQLNVEIDPQIGKARGIVISLALLHAYEFAILIAATIVLRKRRGGGRDLHGMMLVAALFLGGSFLALDELIAITPPLGLVLVPAGLLLAALKILWYARLPGIRLPIPYQAALLAIIGAHTVSPLLGSPEMTERFGVGGAQALAWLCGWVSLLPILWLIVYEFRLALDRNDSTSGVDPLQTPRCGAGAIFMATLTGIAHLYASDWVFDRPADSLLFLPLLTVLSAIMLLLRWYWNPGFEFWNILLASAPALALQWAWNVRSPYQSTLAFGPVLQFWLASVIVYIALARVTRRREFLAGLLGPAAAPIWNWTWRSRGSIPHFRALLSAGMGFLALLAGMLVSLYRERLLGWLDPIALNDGNSMPEISETNVYTAESNAL